MNEWKLRQGNALTICTKVHELMNCSQTFSAVPRWGQRELKEFPQWQLGLHLLLNLNWVKILLVLMKKSSMTEDIRVSCQVPHAYGEGKT